MQNSWKNQDDSIKSEFRHRHLKESSSSLKQSSQIQVPDSQLFQLEEHNLDREAKTWRPLKLDGEVLERTDVNETLDKSDWVPKLGPNVKIRETK